MADVVIGIDPGITGGLAVLTLDGDVVDVAVMPTVATAKGGEVCPYALANWIDGITGTHRIRLAAVEKVGAMPKQGVCACFSFGMSFGIVRGVVGALGIPLELVTPQAWQKVIFAGMPPAAPGGTGKATKTLSVAYCTRRFPGLSLQMTPRSRKAHVGISDAVCIAEYARRMSFGKREAV